MSTRISLVLLLVLPLGLRADHVWKMYDTTGSHPAKSKRPTCTLTDGDTLWLSYWDDECRFGINLDFLPPGQINKITTGDTVSYERNNVDFHIYRKNDVEFEWEIVFKMPPGVNSFSVPIAHDGLTFFWQDSLTQAEIDSGETRPDSATYSWAVYNSVHRWNWKIGNEEYDYQTGKAFHIWRPRAWDADGDTVWCNLDIDTLDETMTLTIPQSFLSSAAYPVTVDPTIGNTSAGASWLSLIESGSDMRNAFSAFKLGSSSGPYVPDQGYLYVRDIEGVKASVYYATNFDWVSFGGSDTVGFMAMWYTDSMAETGTGAWVSGNMDNSTSLGPQRIYYGNTWNQYFYIGAQPHAAATESDNDGDVAYDNASGGSMREAYNNGWPTPNDTFVQGLGLWGTVNYVSAYMSLTAYEPSTGSDQHVTAPVRNWSACGGSGWEATTQDATIFSDDSYCHWYETSVTDGCFYYVDLGLPYSGYTGTIDSLYVIVEGYNSAPQSNKRQYNVQLMKDGSGVGDAVELSFDQTDGDVPDTARGSTNDLWGTTWSLSDFDADFGVVISPQDSRNDYYFDQIRVEVWYSGLTAQGAAADVPQVITIGL